MIYSDMYHQGGRKGCRNEKHRQGRGAEMKSTRQGRGAQMKSTGKRKGCRSEKHRQERGAQTRHKLQEGRKVQKCDTKIRGGRKGCGNEMQRYWKGGGGAGRKYIDIAHGEKEGLESLIAKISHVTDRVANITSFISTETLNVFSSKPKRAPFCPL